MVRDVHSRAVGIELTVDGRRVWEEGELGCNRLLSAGFVAKGRSRSLYEPIANFESLVGKVARLPDGEAGRVAVPLVIRLGDVAHVMDLFTGVIVVDILAVALKVIATVLNTPKPVQRVSSRLLEARRGLTCYSYRNTFRPHFVVHNLHYIR